MHLGHACRVPLKGDFERDGFRDSPLQGQCLGLCLELDLGKGRYPPVDQEKWPSG